MKKTGLIYIFLLCAVLCGCSGNTQNRGQEGESRQENPGAEEDESIETGKSGGDEAAGMEKEMAERRTASLRQNRSDPRKKKCSRRGSMFWRECLRKKQDA